MPKSTFLNLDAEKRDRIIEVCLREFSRYNFREASVTRIVDEAHIAKGSMYKYFEDKKDLYQFLIDHAVFTKLNYIERNRVQDTDSIWTELWSGIEAGARFDFEHPLYAQFLDRVLSPANDVFDIDTRTAVINQSHEYILQFILKGVASGEIRDDVEPELIGRFVNIVLTKASQILAESRNMSIFEFTGMYSDASYTEIISEVQDLYQLIISGISKKEK
jgi:AcrR family transcriptional regulator